MALGLGLSHFWMVKCMFRMKWNEVMCHMRSWTHAWSIFLQDDDVDPDSSCRSSRSWTRWSWCFCWRSFIREAGIFLSIWEASSRERSLLLLTVALLEKRTMGDKILTNHVSSVHVLLSYQPCTLCELLDEENQCVFDIWSYIIL